MLLQDLTLSNQTLTSVVTVSGGSAWHRSRGGGQRRHIAAASGACKWYFYLLRSGNTVFLVYMAAAKSLKNLTTSVSELFSDRSR